MSSCAPHRPAAPASRAPRPAPAARSRPRHAGPAPLVLGFTFLTVWGVSSMRPASSVSPDYATPLFLGCSRPAEPKERADARALELVLAADRALENTLREADQRARTDEAAAATILETRAVTQANAVCTQIASVPVETPWGRDRRDELRRLFEARRDELPSYARALRSGAAEDKLRALTRQIELQQKLLDAEQRVTIVPP